MPESIPQLLPLLAVARALCVSPHTVRALQCDEIWAFVYGKDKNLTMEQVQAGAGSVWTWTTLDADSKLFVHSGRSRSRNCCDFHEGC